MVREPLAARAPVLMYHRVGTVSGPEDEKYCVAPDRFCAHMRSLARRGMRACSITDFLAWLLEGAPLDPGSFLLTFDDGFLGVYQHAFPVLRGLGWPFAVFLVSDRIGATDTWNAASDEDARKHPLLGRTEIAAMQQGGASFQSHTRCHPDLTRLDDAALEEELAGSKRDLEALLGAPVECLAYPYGRLDERVVTAAREAGYRAAFSVQPGFNRPGTDPFRIRRLDVFGGDSSAALTRKIALGSNDGSLHSAGRYYLDRLRRRFGRATA